MIVLISLDAYSQVVQLGSGTAVNSITTASPVNIYYRRQVCQFVYTAAEINAAGAVGANTLTQLGFFVTTNPLYDIPGYTIKIKHTTQTNVGNALGTTGWTTVKNPFTYTPTPLGYDMIIFDTPFNWDGVSNIAVEICWSQVQPGFEDSGQCRIYNSNRGYRYSRDDNAGSICGASPTIRNNNKPQAQLVFKITSTWTGTANNDWFNTANWDTGVVPDEEMHALIPVGPANMPIISSLGATCKDLTIDAGASLTLSGSNEITIYRNWINNGTFVANTGNVTLKGTEINNINGAFNQDIYDLTIDNIHGAIISSGSIDLRGTLNVDIATGNFNTNNALKIVSNANGTGRIGELATKCLYTLDMSDSYGDSWNGAFITVLVDGVFVGEYSSVISNSTSQFIAPIGSTVQLNYTAGLYENENSYELIDGSGTTIFSDGPTPSTGTNVFSTTAGCSFFNPISGNITMERYIDAGATNWRFLTSATSGTTLADFNDDFITSGFTGSDFPLWPTAIDPWESIYFYDETQLGEQEIGFTPASNVTNAVGIGEGLWIWCGDTIIGTQPFTIDMTGPPNVGDIQLPVTYTNSGMPTEDGWSMVGNPYPSTIDWDSPNITKTGINNAIYIWNPDLQVFASYVGGLGINGGSNNIASSQAFWVQTNTSSPSVTVTEACKTTTDGAFLKAASPITPFKIKTQNNSGQDEMIIHFNNNATNNFDPAYDARKMVSADVNLPNISSVINGVDYSINQIAEQEISIPIKILTGVTGFHTISFENVSAISNNSCVVLEDLFSGISYHLTDTSSYTTFIYDTTTIARFLLHIGASKNITSTPISCYGNNDASIVFSKNSTTPFDILWKNNHGDTLSVQTSVLLKDSITNIPNGTYYIESTDLLCGSTTNMITIDSLPPITPLFDSPDTIYIANGGTSSFVNQSINANDFLWDFGDGNTVNSISPTHTYLQEGNYLVRLNAYQSLNCYDSFSKNVTVLNLTTGINNVIDKTSLKAWIENNFLNLNLNNLIYDKLEIRNTLGQLIFVKHNLEDDQKISLTNFSSSIYFINLFRENEVNTIKIPHIK